MLPTTFPFTLTFAYVSQSSRRRTISFFARKSPFTSYLRETIQQGLSELVRALKGSGFWVALETNGIHKPHHPEIFDYIAVSPKSDYASRYMDSTMLHNADEVRIVAVTDEIAPFCRSIRERITATDYYISPLEKDGKIHYRRALSLLKKVNKLYPVMPPWSLSIQMHKVLGIR